MHENLPLRVSITKLLHLTAVLGAQIPGCPRGGNTAFLGYVDAGPETSLLNLYQENNPAGRVDQSQPATSFPQHLSSTHGTSVPNFTFTLTWGFVTMGRLQT